MDASVVRIDDGDGMGGLADYGEFPFFNGGSYTTPDGTTYYLAQ